jgi:hypothetical protein
LPSAKRANEANINEVSLQLLQFYIIIIIIIIFINSYVIVNYFQNIAPKEMDCLPILQCNAYGEGVGGASERKNDTPSAEKDNDVDDNEVSLIFAN